MPTSCVSEGCGSASEELCLKDGWRELMELKEGCLEPGSVSVEYCCTGATNVAYTGATNQSEIEKCTIISCSLAKVRYFRGRLCFH